MLSLFNMQTEESVIKIRRVLSLFAYYFEGVKLSPPSSPFKTFITNNFVKH